MFKYIFLGSFYEQVTAVHPVGEGQCIALGYESVLPLALLTLQGGDVKPYEFPREGAKAMAGSGEIDNFSCTVNPLSPNSDENEISLYIINTCSDIQVMRI